MTTAFERLHGVGVDLGTSNSAICRVDISKGFYDFQLALDTSGAREIPSAVFIDSDTTLQFGSAAEYRQRSREHAARVLTNFKLVLRSNGPIEVPEVGAVEPVDLVRKFLGYLKQCYEHQFKEPCTQATITVPAHEDFDFDFRERVRTAVLESPGTPLFDAFSIIAEPDAVLLSMIDLEPLDGRTVLVFDMGGGTLDISIRRIRFEGEKPNLDHLAVFGSSAAGVQVTRALGAHVLAEWERRAGVSFDELDRQRALDFNHFALDQAKRQLSSISRQHGTDSTRGFDVHLMYPNIGVGEFTVHVSAEDLTELSRPTCEEAIETLEKAIARAGLTASEIDEYFVVGGSSMLPLMEELLIERMGREPTKTMGLVGTIDPLQAVARGAAIHNLTLDDRRDTSVPDTRPHLENRIPYAISLVVNRGTCTEVLVPEGSVLPFGPLDKLFYVPEEGDTEVSIQLVRGEGHPDATIPVATRTVYFGRPQRQGAAFRISWRADESGLLTLTAEDSNGEDLAVLTAPTLEGSP